MTIIKTNSRSLPVGSVVQTIPVAEMTSTSFASSDSSTPRTFMSGSITPTSTSHKILLFGFLSMGGLYSNYSGTFNYFGVKIHYIYSFGMLTIKPSNSGVTSI